MTFKWTKHFRAYDLDSFTGSDNSIPGHPQRYKFTKGNGDTVATNAKENFMQESGSSASSFLGWHSDDMRAAFGFRKFADLASAQNYFALVPHGIHAERIIETNFGLVGDDTLKMTITFKSKEEWQKFVEINHDGIKPITHGMEHFKVGLEYDKDYDSSQGHL